MPRARKGAARRQAKTRWFKAASGYRGAKSRNWRSAKQAVVRAGVYATAHRRSRKREYRQLWITRINAAAKMRGLNYSTLASALKAADINLNRKMLSQIAILDPAGFDAIVELAKAAGDQKAAA